MNIKTIKAQATLPKANESDELLRAVAQDLRKNEEDERNIETLFASNRRATESNTENSQETKL